MPGNPVLLGRLQVAPLLQPEADVAQHGEPRKGRVALEHHALLAAGPEHGLPARCGPRRWWASRARRPSASPWSCRSRTGRRRRRTRLPRWRGRAARPPARGAAAMLEDLGQVAELDEISALGHGSISSDSGTSGDAANRMIWSETRPMMPIVRMPAKTSGVLP